MTVEELEAELRMLELELHSLRFMNNEAELAWMNLLWEMEQAGEI